MWIVVGLQQLMTQQGMNNKTSFRITVQRYSQPD
jgi:hypothetical protein